MKKYFCEKDCKSPKCLLYIPDNVNLEDANFSGCPKDMEPIWHKIEESDEKTYICNAECPLYCMDEYSRCKVKIPSEMKLEETTASSICPIDYVPKWEEITDNEEEGEGECILRA